MTFTDQDWEILDQLQSCHDESNYDHLDFVSEFTARAKKLAGYYDLEFPV